MKIVSWNCRGMGSRIKEEGIRSLIKTKTPNILLIQETKLEDFVFLQASKKLWRKCELLFKLLHLDSKEIISLFNIYIPVNAVEKKSCWDSIGTQVDLVNLENIIIAGDLNLTLLSIDKRGGSIARDPAREWAEDLMLDWDLLDIKPISDKEAQLHQNFHKACLTEEEYWRLKSRSLWLKVGDRNSSFVHKQAQAMKCTNAISEIKDGTITHKDNTSIKKAASLHFKSLYSEDKNLDQSSDMIDVVPSLITVELNHLLEAKVTKNEVKDPLFDMDPGKALGPDGFTARFLQSC
eukprot:PITA_13757